MCLQFPSLFHNLCGEFIILSSCIRIIVLVWYFPSLIIGLCESTTAWKHCGAYYMRVQVRTFFFAIDEIRPPTPNPSTESILPRGNSCRGLLLRIHEVKINGPLTREAEFQVGVFRWKGMCCNGTCNLFWHCYWQFIALIGTKTFTFTEERTGLMDNVEEEGRAGVEGER
jgi:hypothetical protein